MEKKNISILDLNIIYEIDYQLDKQLSDDYNKLYSNVEWAYLKLEGIALDNIVRCGIKNLDKLDDNNFDFRNECCYY